MYEIQEVLVHSLALDKVCDILNAKVKVLKERSVVACSLLRERANVLRFSRSEGPHLQGSEARYFLLSLRELLRPRVR